MRRLTLHGFRTAIPYLNKREAVCFPGTQVGASWLKVITNGIQRSSEPQNGRAMLASGSLNFSSPPSLCRLWGSATGMTRDDAKLKRKVTIHGLTGQKDEDLWANLKRSLAGPVFHCVLLVESSDFLWSERPNRPINQG